jgi:hypothetical protein
MGQAVGGALSAMLGGEGGEGLFGSPSADGPVIELGMPDLGER